MELYNRFIPHAAQLDIDSTHSARTEMQHIAKSLDISPEKLDTTVGRLQALYAITDHTRTLVFAIADGALPSNVGGGYNLRVLLRRALGFQRKYKIPFSLHDVADWLIADLRPWFKELDIEKEQIHKILKVEINRAHEAVTRTSHIVGDLLKKGKTKPTKDGRIRFSTKQLVQLYESQGVTPDQIQAAAESLHQKIIIPPDVYTEITKGHETTKKTTPEKKPQLNIENLLKKHPPTTKLYYEKMYQRKFQAKVLASQKRKGSGGWVLLDKTAFYPEGGGQPTDKGTLNGVKVHSAEIVGQHVIHHVKKDIDKLSNKTVVEGELDWDRRFSLMQHHTGTHLLLAATRKILGNHVWQWGSQLRAEGSRLDISHYEQLTREELNNLEKQANDYIQQNVKVKAMWMPRRKAEDKYGPRLYQGGVVPGKTIRVMETEGIDYEACGGTHVRQTGDIGTLLITRSKRIQDGVVRLEFVCGRRAIDILQKERNNLLSAANLANVEASQLPTSIEKLQKENRKLRKRIKQLASATATVITPEKIDHQNHTIHLYTRTNAEDSINDLLLQADKIAKSDPQSVVLLVNPQPKPIFVLAVGKKLPYDVMALAKSFSKVLQGGAGAVDKHLAQGGGQDASKIPDAIDTLKQQF
jgi:alanyl-tRNA synthetase